MRARVRAARVVLGLFYTCNVAPYGVYVDPELNRCCAPGVLCARNMRKPQALLLGSSE